MLIFIGTVILFAVIWALTHKKPEKPSNIIGEEIEAVTTEYKEYISRKGLRAS